VTAEAQIGGRVGSSLVPAALRLPSNAEYLAHLTAATGAEKLIRLASNENTEPPSPRVREALERSYGDANLSPPPQSPLHLALAKRHHVDPSQILVTAGSTEVIDAVIRTFARAGSEVVLPDPSWPVFRRRLEAVEARIVAAPLALDGDGYHYDTERFLSSITDETRLAIVCSPNNPTGNAMAMADLRRVAETGVPMLLDAAYADFDSAGEPMALVHELPNVVITRTFSKAYCLAGLRVGYAVGDARLLDYVDRFLVPGSSVSTTALHAGLAALEDEAYHDHQVRRIVTERGRLHAALVELGLHAYPSRGNFVPVDCSAREEGALGLAAALLEHGIVVRPLGDIVRISIGRREENDAVIAALRTSA
jgi:histidinol-phosphate aminotransferase